VLRPLTGRDVAVAQWLAQFEEVHGMVRDIAAFHYGLGVVSYSPLARGVLSGKYAIDAPPPPESRAGRGDKRIQQTEWRAESLQIAQAIAQRAAQRGTTPVAFALAWVLNNQLVSAQWDSYLDALSFSLNAEDEQFIDARIPPGHASTPGYTDPNYPVEGRRPRSVRA